MSWPSYIYSIVSWLFSLRAVSHTVQDTNVVVHHMSEDTIKLQRLSEQMIQRLERTQSMIRYVSEHNDHILPEQLLAHSRKNHCLHADLNDYFVRKTMIARV